MADQPEARIVARQKANGRTEISVYEPERMREHRTGWSEGEATTDKAIRDLKDRLERAGNHVTFKQL